MVKESSPTLIYMFLQPKPVRLRESKKILDLIFEEYKTLPFAKRWLKDVGSSVSLHLALRELVNKDILKEYPSLKERSNGIIAQTEETIIVLDKPKITTKR
jgi:methionyl aminopeptidase